VLQGSTLLRCWCLFLFFRGIYISAHPFQGTPPITSNVVRGLILSLTKEHTYATWRWNHSGPGPANRQDQINATTAASAVVNAARACFRCSALPRAKHPVRCVQSLHFSTNAAVKEQRTREGPWERF
jgi:hypothetical protein